MSGGEAAQHASPASTPPLSLTSRGSRVDTSQKPVQTREGGPEWTDQTSLLLTSAITHTDNNRRLGETAVQGRVRLLKFAFKKDPPPNIYTQP